MAFTEVADRVWVARYDWFDVNVTLVGGDRGLLVVDTHASGLAARAVDRRRAPARAPASVVRRRQHPRALRPHLRQRRRSARRTATCRSTPTRSPPSARWPAGERDQGAVRRRARRPAPRRGAGDRDRAGRPHLLLGASRSTSATGGRAGAPGPRPHRRRPGAAGARRRRAARRRPGRGVDGARRRAGLRRRLLPAGVAAHPRHRAQPDHLARPSSCPGTARPSTASSSRSSATRSASSPQTIRDLAARGVPVDEALAAAEWPYPREELAAAVRRGYEQLPRSQKRLPLV